MGFEPIISTLKGWRVNQLLQGIMHSTCIFTDWVDNHQLFINKQKHHHHVVASTGLEPIQIEPKSIVLPLHQEAVFNSRCKVK